MKVARLLKEGILIAAAVLSTHVTMEENSNLIIILPCETIHVQFLCKVMFITKTDLETQVIMTTFQIENGLSAVLVDTAFGSTKLFLRIPRQFLYNGIHGF